MNNKPADTAKTEVARLHDDIRELTSDWPEYEPTWKAIEARVMGAQPAPSDEYVGWYCAHCERGVDASEVTYHEQHEACGRVITDDRPPKPAQGEEARLVSYHPDGDTCTLNINGVEMYYDRVDRNTQPAPSVPCGWIQRGMAELAAIRNRLDDDTLLDDRTLIERIGSAMLAAPEAKP